MTPPKVSAAAYARDAGVGCRKQDEVPRPDPDRVPLVAHVIYRLDVGGLENGLVNIVNRMPADRYRHVVICLTQYTHFRSRIHRADVHVFALHKRKGKDFMNYIRLWQVLRQLRPDILHTRNLPTVDSVLIGVLAGVRCRVHSEHGRDMLELDGNNRKYNFLRRVCRPFVHTYIPLSHELAKWLRDKIGVRNDKIEQIYNGVDTQCFYPTGGERETLPAGFAPVGTFVIGSVGRLVPIKDPLTLVCAFIHLLDVVPDGRKRLRLVLVGDGPLRQQLERALTDANATANAWLAHTRDDVPRLLRGLDIFALSSLSEGISNTILEAMATGLPVVATGAGGTPELIIDGVTGTLVRPGDPLAMAEVLHKYIDQPALIRRQGRAARERVEQEFDVDLMVRRYQAVYDKLLNMRAPVG
jgi:sugar transferase (PEP-CTERM/EpsH1 system associated)